MTSSDNFDAFMKALGVGMVKRKMANSVTPVNVIEKETDGERTDFGSFVTQLPRNARNI